MKIQLINPQLWIIAGNNGTFDSKLYQAFMKLNMEIQVRGRYSAPYIWLGWEYNNLLPRQLDDTLT